MGSACRLSLCEYYDLYGCPAGSFGVNVSLNSRPCCRRCRTPAWSTRSESLFSATPRFRETTRPVKSGGSPRLRRSRLRRATTRAGTRASTTPSSSASMSTFTTDTVTPTLTYIRRQIPFLLLVSLALYMLHLDYGHLDYGFRCFGLNKGAIICAS